MRSLAGLALAVPLAGAAAEELAPPCQDPVSEYAARAAAAAGCCAAGAPLGAATSRHRS